MDGEDAADEMIFEEFIEAITALSLMRKSNPYLPTHIRVTDLFQTLIDSSII